MRFFLTSFLTIALVIWLVGSGWHVARIFAQDKSQPAKSSSTLQHTKAKKEQIIARLEARLPTLMKEANVPGLSVALLRDGELVWQRGFGLKNAQTGDPVTDATVFEAASLSKPVFAYAC